MKKPIVLALAATLVTSSAFAEAPEKKSSTTTTTTTTAVPVVPNPPALSPAVGISARDGITVSGTDVMMTRNGVTERLTNELKLSNGTKVMPDGKIMTSEGATIRLRRSQVLGFDGNIIYDPIDGSVGAKKAPLPAAAQQSATAPNAAQQQQQQSEEAARVEARRRAESMSRGPTKAGEGVQK